MNELISKNGEKIKVDPKIYKLLKGSKITISKLGYVNVKFSLSRFVLGFPEDAAIDHRTGDKLDNRKINLRACTRKENARNARISKKNTSGFKGVSFMKTKTGSNWVAKITVDRKARVLGHFFSKYQAAIAYNEAAIDLFGKFANLNKIPSKCIHGTYIAIKCSRCLSRPTLEFKPRKIYTRI